jgi:AhpD family alkylhydroperoxidase
MTRVMANSPATLEAYIQFSSALEGGSLDAKCRERIALGTAEANRCEYCLSAHTAIGKMVGLDDSEILDSRQAHAKNAKANAALHFSRLILEERGAVRWDDIEAARRGGLTDGEIAEVVGLTVLNIFTNYFNTAFEVDTDFPGVSPAGFSPV